MIEQRDLPLFPLNTVLFPGMALPLHIFEERYKLMIERCLRESQPFGVVLIRSGEEVGPGATIYNVGTTAHITQTERLPDGRLNIATLGYRRFKVHEVRREQPYLIGRVADFPLESADNRALKQSVSSLFALLRSYLDIFATLGKVELPHDALNRLPHDPETLAFLVAIVLQMPMKDKQMLLDVPDLPALITLEKRMLKREAHILKLLIDYGRRWRDDPRPFGEN